jgi:hypothetical protein
VVPLRAMWSPRAWIFGGDLTIWIHAVLIMEASGRSQDQVFLFWYGLTNYKADYLLSWFRSLLGGSSPTFTNLILKINNGYNGVSKALGKFFRQEARGRTHSASSPRAFSHVGDRSRSFDKRQNRYSHVTAGTAIGLSHGHRASWYDRSRDVWSESGSMTGVGTYMHYKRV